jgi:phytanoyl-CoA hydroxylase
MNAAKDGSCPDQRTSGGLDDAAAGAAAGAARKAQIDALRAAGYVVVPDFLPPAELERLNVVARAQLAARTRPLELEADLKYPGAPPSRASAGGGTVRRLLEAFARDPAFAGCATAPRVQSWMAAYFAEPVLMSRAHHNCLMTKHPRYGSLTGWHRDIRYWSFEREDLISVWFALGREAVDNGGLWFVPGSHTREFAAERFDAAKFFRAEHPDNAALIRTAVAPSLAPGDAVFFHCNTLHSAGRNTTDAVKYSLVFTYHGRSNAPLGGTRSAAQPEVALGAARPQPHGPA